MVERVKHAVKDKFRPELLNRIDEVVVFRHLDELHIRHIIDKFIGNINERLKDRKITVELEESAYVGLMDAGYSREYGAREMERIINRLLSAPLAEAILNGDFKKGDKVIIKGTADGLVFLTLSLEHV